MKIFLVDDDQLTTFLTKQWLLHDGFSGQIETYFSASQALQTLLVCPEGDLPNLIFLDLNMPVMSGWEFLELLMPHQERFIGRCHVYILTSSLSMEDKKRSQQCPLVSDFIHKPIKPEDLKVIRESLALH